MRFDHASILTVVAFVGFGCAPAVVAPTMPLGSYAAPPSQQQILDEANRAETKLTQDAREGADRAEQLRKNVFWGNVITKIGQYTGGAGAILFGLDENGSNAAYSGAVAAAFTLNNSGASILRSNNESGALNWHGFAETLNAKLHTGG